MTSQRTREANAVGMQAELYDPKYEEADRKAAHDERNEQQRILNAIEFMLLDFKDAECGCDMDIGDNGDPKAYPCHFHRHEESVRMALKKLESMWCGQESG